MADRGETLYQEIMLAIDRRRQQMGVPMWALDDAAGTQDGYYAKCLHFEDPSGRMARYQTLELILGALYPGGFRIKIEATELPMHAQGSMKTRIRLAQFYWDWRVRGKAIVDWCRKGAEARNEALTPERRSEIARGAAKARWSKPRILSDELLKA